MNGQRSNEQPGFWATFLPGKQRIRNLPGETLLDCARRAGIRIASVCGGRGLCKSCVVRVTDGPISAPTAGDRAFLSETEVATHWRRACQTFLAGDCQVEVSARALALPTRTYVESEDVWIHPDPAVRLCRITVPAASLQSPQADDQRLMNALNARWAGAGSRIDSDVQRALPAVLRDAGGRVAAAVRFGEIIGLMASHKGPVPGLAVDVGTTNISMLLVDLRTGRTLASRGLENPQGLHGADVITRIGYARSSPEALDRLRQLAITAINCAAASLCASRSLSPAQIADVVIVGNTTMHHLLLGLPVDQLAKAPFVPAVSNAVDIKARDLGITVMPGAYVHMLPNIAGFVGADHTAVLLAISSDRERRTVLALDIGTNTEISLLHHGKLASLSSPSGPALEGGHIACGMRSGPGAIESVEIVGDAVRIKTIDDATPVGICGSGVLDVTAQLCLAGIVDASGRMLEGHPRVRTRNGQREFILADERETGGEPVVFSQCDLRAVQLAKGAVRAGVSVLLEHAGLSEDQLDQVIIAGGFGNYISLASAVAIDMLPALPLDRFAQIGNAAAIGAKLALVSCPHRAEAQVIARSGHYLELANSAGFNGTFMKSIRFPPRRTPRAAANNVNSAIDHYR